MKPRQEVRPMQEDAIPEEVLISTCPKCGTRLMSGKIIIGGLLQCAKCKRHWQVEMDAGGVIGRSEPSTD